MFIKGYLLSLGDVAKALKDRETVRHSTTNPEVRTSSVMLEVYFNQNVTATYNLLEATRKAGSIKTLVFTSSFPVYGEQSKILTPEDYVPLLPISVHGAANSPAKH